MPWTCAAKAVGIMSGRVRGAEEEAASVPVAALAGCAGPCDVVVGLLGIAKGPVLTWGGAGCCSGCCVRGMAEAVAPSLDFKAAGGGTWEKEKGGRGLVARGEPLLSGAGDRDASRTRSANAVRVPRSARRVSLRRLASAASSELLNHSAGSGVGARRGVL